jgi:hypothetical protein
MSDRNLRVLQLLRLPARLTGEEVGALLGFHPESISFLVSAGLLKSLGETDHVQMMFAAVYIRRLCGDERWLTKATIAVRQHHRQKNAAQKARRDGHAGHEVGRRNFAPGACGEQFQGAVAHKQPIPPHAEKVRRHGGEQGRDNRPKQEPESMRT